MNVLEQIRPCADHLTDERSRQLLATVLTEQRPSPTRRWNRLAAAALGGVLVAGGTAYATGLVPGFVSERFEQMGRGPDGWPDPITNQRLVADIALTTGVHARIWYADTTDGQCEIRDMTGASRSDDLPVECSRWNPGERTDPRRGVYWQTAPGGPAVVYGDFAGVRVDVAAVQVTGRGWVRTFPVLDGSFGGQVPAGTDGDRLRWTYLDGQGDPVATRADRVTLESE